MIADFEGRASIPVSLARNAELTRARSLIRVSFSASIERFLIRSRRGMLRVQQKLIKHAQQHRAAGCIDITGPKIGERSR